MWWTDRRTDRIAMAKTRYSSSCCCVYKHIFHTKLTADDETRCSNIQSETRNLQNGMDVTRKASPLPSFFFSSLLAFKSCNADIFLVSFLSSTTFRRSLLLWLTDNVELRPTLLCRWFSFRFASRSFFSISNLKATFSSHFSSSLLQMQQKTSAQCCLIYPHYTVNLK